MEMKKLISDLQDQNNTM